MKVAAIAIILPATQAFFQSRFSSRLVVPRALRAPPSLRCRSTVTCSATETAWGTAQVVSNVQAAEGTRILKINAGDVAAGYKNPGQFVQIKKGDGKPSFFAIASAPSADGNTLEFLVKEAESNAWLCEAGSGEQLSMSAVMGNGFAIAENFEGYKYDFPVQNVLLVCTGTGIAPIKAAIESGRLEVGENDVFGRSCRLYWGVRSDKHIAYSEELAAWEARGIEVVPVLSGGGSGGFGGAESTRHGYVQQALAADGVRVPRNTGVLLVGQKEMANDVKELCKRANVLEGRVLLNF